MSAVALGPIGDSQLKTTRVLSFSLLLAAKALAGEMEDTFAKKIRALYEARDIEGLLALVEFGDDGSSSSIAEMKRKSFEFVANAKIVSVQIESMTEQEKKDFAAPFEQDGVTYGPTLDPTTKAIIAFQDATPGPVKISSIAQPLGIKDGEYRIVTAVAKKSPAPAGAKKRDGS